MKPQSDTVRPPDPLADVLSYVAGKVASRYVGYVERDDIFQQLALYAYGDGARMVERDLSAEGERHRLYLALFGVARQYAEREKAHRSGYDFSDVAWYSPEQLEDLLPLATDPSWDGLGSDPEGPSGRTASPREGGTLLAMIVDVRRALAFCPAAAHVVTSGQSGPVFDDALVTLAEFLGGEYPYAPTPRPRRRAVSNERAQSTTRRHE